MRNSFIVFSLFFGFFGAGCSDLAGVSNPPAPAPVYFDVEQEVGETTVLADGTEETGPVDETDDAELEAWIRGSILTYFQEQESLRRFIGKEFTLEQIKKQPCLGCFSATAVFLTPGDAEARKVIVFTFSQWRITEAAVAEERVSPLTEAICIDRGGRAMAVTERSVCPEGMMVLGRISDLDGFRACCLP